MSSVPISRVNKATNRTRRTRNTHSDSKIKRKNGPTYWRPLCKLSSRPGTITRIMTSPIPLKSQKKCSKMIHLNETPVKTTYLKIKSHPLCSPVSSGQSKTCRSSFWNAVKMGPQLRKRSLRGCSSQWCMSRFSCLCRPRATRAPKAPH